MSAPAAPLRPPDPRDPMAHAAFDVVVPSVGRPGLDGLLWVICHALPAGAELVVVDDRRPGAPPLEPGVDDSRLRVVRSGGRGPAAARNVGWRTTSAPWVAFVDDDVEPPLSWVRDLADDLRRAPAGTAAVQGRVEVPMPADRPATDWERNVAGLDGATWITADMAVRREALAQVGGFDERFARAYREDTDLALRLLDAGWRLDVGQRRVRHPVREAPWWVSVSLQRGNADDVLLDRIHGPGWRERVEAGRRAPTSYPTITALGAGALAALASGRRRLAAAAVVAWALRTGRFWWARTAPGPRTVREMAAMAVTSAAIPPVACYHRIRGALRWRGVAPVDAPGDAPAGPRPIARIAVVRALPGLGDLLCAVPALRAVRAAHPAARVTLVGLPSAGWFLDRYPDLVDDLLPVEGVPGLPEVEPDPAAAVRFDVAAQARRFDLALQLHGSGVVTNSLTTMLGARHQVTAHLPDRWRPPGTSIAYPSRGPEIRRLLAVVDAAGCPPVGEEIDLPVRPAERAEARALVAGPDGRRQPYVCLHPGAARADNRWPAPRVAALADRLAAAGHRVVLTGTAGERDLVAEVADAMAAPPIDASGRTGVGTLGALFAAARLVVSNDTGAAHVAAAVQAPSVVVYPAGADRARWAPLDTGRHVGVSPEPGDDPWPSVAAVLVAAARHLPALAPVPALEETR